MTPDTHTLCEQSLWTSVHYQAQANTPAHGLSAPLSHNEAVSLQSDLTLAAQLVAHVGLSRPCAEAFAAYCVVGELVQCALVVAGDCTSCAVAGPPSTGIDVCNITAHTALR